MSKRMKMQLSGMELKRVHELAFTTENPNALPEPDLTKVRLLLSAEREAMNRGLSPTSVTRAILWIREDGSEFVELHAPNPAYRTLAKL